jgi:hypothetical protein
MQLPLRLAYATTFNGCVGLTLDRTVLDQRTPVFAHGQLYTRIRHRRDSRILLKEGVVEAVSTNVVYCQLLLM